MAHDLRPFRDYDEKDVINLYAYNASSSTLESTPINKGLLVKINTGWSTSNNDLAMLEGAGANTVANTVAQRYKVNANVTAAGAGNACIGMTLYDLREKDENGELLKFNPRKAAEMQAVLAGQEVPIVTKGIFLVETDTDIDGGAEGGVVLFADAAGEFTSTGTMGTHHSVGQTLGPSVSTTNAAGTACYHTLIQLDCHNGSSATNI